MAKQKEVFILAKATGTKNADTITVKVNEVVIGKKRIPINKSGKNYISGEAGKDTIYVKSGKSNYIYGDDKKGKKSGADKIIISGGSNNTIRGGKGKDTFTVNGGTKNYLYGGAGNDVFVIGSNSTGSATVKDFTATDKVKVIGSVSNIYASGKSMIIKGGKKGKTPASGDGRLSGSSAAGIFTDGRFFLRKTAKKKRDLKGRT